MRPASWPRRLSHHAIDFVKARRGNVAVTFVIALIPVMITVGAAIDYSRLSLARTAMQAALDFDRVDAVEGSRLGHHHASAAQ